MTGHGSDREWRVLAKPRLLSANERAVLANLINTARPELRSALRAQVEHAQVHEEGADSCGSIVLVVNRSAAPAVNLQRAMVSNADSRVVDGGHVSVLLHVRDGYIDFLEAYRSDQKPCPNLPLASELNYLGG